MTPGNGAANAADETARGDDALRAARVLLDAGLFNDAISRAYFAAYHYASALLLTKGLEPKTHRGTIRLLSLHFVRPGLLSEEASGHLSRLEDFRELCDYAAAVALERQDAEDAIRRAERFVEACRPLLPRFRGRVEG